MLLKEETSYFYYEIFSSLMLKNFSSHFDLKALLNAFHKWSPLFQWTWTRLNFPLQKGLPWCMAGYETWFTGATLIEIGVYVYKLRSGVESIG